MSLDLQDPDVGIPPTHWGKTDFSVDKTIKEFSNGTLNGHVGVDDDDDESSSSLDDPFYLGYRYKRNRDGSYEQIPLTEMDWVHPKPGDVRVATPKHRKSLLYCWWVLTNRCNEHGRGIVLCEQQVGWNRLNLQPPIRDLCPDITVVSNAPLNSLDDYKGTYQVLPNRIPNLVIEALSKSTAHLDQGVKLEYYQRIGVDQLILIDVRKKKRKPRRPLIQSYLLENVPGEDGGPPQRVYVEQPADIHGRVSVPWAGLHLGFEGQTAYFYDQNGQRMPGYEDIGTALQESQGNVATLRQQLTQQAQDMRRLQTEKLQAQALFKQTMELVLSGSSPEELAEFLRQNAQAFLAETPTTIGPEQT